VGQSLSLKLLNVPVGHQGLKTAAVSWLVIEVDMFSGHFVLLGLSFFLCQTVQEKERLISPLWAFHGTR
jgi:hypothetical protein